MSVYRTIGPLVLFQTTSGHEVLVMEYCSGGSLYNMLEQPQYAYGFPEDEFLLFLSHTGKSQHTDIPFSIITLE